MNNYTYKEKIINFLTKNIDSIKTPLYLYDESEIISSINRFKSLYPKNAKLFYSLKANPNPNVAKLFYNNGLGIEITEQIKGESPDCKRIKTNANNGYS